MTGKEKLRYYEIYYHVGCERDKPITPHFIVIDQHPYIWLRLEENKIAKTWENAGHHFSPGRDRVILDNWQEVKKEDYEKYLESLSI